MAYLPIDDEFNRRVNYYLSLLRRGYVKEQHIKKIEGILISRGLDPKIWISEFYEKLENKKTEEKAEKTKKEFEKIFSNEKVRVLEKIPENIEQIIEDNAIEASWITPDTYDILKTNAVLLEEYSPESELKTHKETLSINAMDCIEGFVKNIKNQNAGVACDIFSGFAILFDKQIMGADILYNESEYKDLLNTYIAEIYSTLRNSVIADVNKFLQNNVNETLKKHDNLKNIDESTKKYLSPFPNERKAYKYAEKLIQKYGTFNDIELENFEMCDGRFFMMIEHKVIFLVISCVTEAIKQKSGFDFSKKFLKDYLGLGDDYFGQEDNPDSQDDDY